ncbi:hypothetical protein E4U32_004842 [Claviceps aff. humidiphila group G2b]|nr:hypothetical protein E4U32_004842 [Claviceps aff. humidiphila group G2b]
MSLGNDDQGFWGLSAMLAAENKFPDPPTDQPQWLALAQAVWNTQADPSRYDKTCGGGLRWQIPFSNQGYGYKNTIANGIFFNMGARLARYTKNTYAQRAEEAWDWMWDRNYIDHKTWAAYESERRRASCRQKLHRCEQGHIFIQCGRFSARISSRMASLTRYLASSEGSNGKGTCTPDMLSFKGYVRRWLSVITQVAPYTRETILPILRKSTEAAVKQCTGGQTGRQCGFYWNLGEFVDPAVDRTTGAGEVMNVLAAVSSL